MKSFEFFSLPFSSDFQRICSLLKIERLCNHRELMLDGTDTLPSRLLPLFEEAGISDPTMNSIVVGEVIRVLKTFQERSGMECGILIVRTHPPSTIQFKERRWHMDGYWFQGGYEKYGMTLVGPSTLFAENVSKEIRKILTKEELTTLNSDAIVRSSNTEEAYKWVIGRPETAAIHSEPYSPMEGRIFVSFTPGTRDQVATLLIGSGK